MTEWLPDISVISNAVISQGILVGALWGWASRKGKVLEDMHNDLKDLKNINEAKDLDGHLIVYGKDSDIIKILDKLSDVNMSQLEILREIRREDQEIRNDFNKHVCPFKGVKDLGQ